MLYDGKWHSIISSGTRGRSAHVNPCYNLPTHPGILFSQTPIVFSDVPLCKVPDNFAFYFFRERACSVIAEKRAAFQASAVVAYGKPYQVPGSTIKT